MNIVTDHSQEGETRFHISGLSQWRLGYGETNCELVVIVTTEGIIMDVYDKVMEYNGVVIDDTHRGTMGMTFDEWADEVVSFDSPTKLSE
tara:strand:- start:707 stop:976 length:270 start_codon:yes stop_codon:yes gene_type:complete